MNMRDPIIGIVKFVVLCLLLIYIESMLGTGTYMLFAILFTFIFLKFRQWAVGVSVLAITGIIFFHDTYQTYNVLMSEENMKEVLDKGYDEALAQACKKAAVGNRESVLNQEIVLEATKGVDAYMGGKPLGGMTSVASATDAYVHIQVIAAEMLGGAFGNFDIALNRVEIPCSPHTNWW